MATPPSMECKGGAAAGTRSSLTAGPGREPATAKPRSPNATSTPPKSNSPAPPPAPKADVRPGRFVRAAPQMPEAILVCEPGIIWANNGAESQTRNPEAGGISVETTERFAEELGASIHRDRPRHHLRRNPRAGWVAVDSLHRAREHKPRDSRLHSSLENRPRPIQVLRHQDRAEIGYRRLGGKLTNRGHTSAHLHGRSHLPHVRPQASGT